jgi:hypothetical protein
MKAVRLAILCFLIFCIFAGGLFIGSLFRKSAPTPPQILPTATILKQVQTLSELVTVKYVLEKIVVLEDTKWYGENRVVLVAHGVAKGGVDFTKVSPDDIQASQNKITMRLPKPVLLEAFLDERKTQVMEHSTGVLRTFDKNLQKNARMQALAAITRGARELGIERDAEENARKQITGLLHQLGFAEVELQFR